MGGHRLEYIAFGILIEAFRKKYGHLPPWNEVGGSTAGYKRVMQHKYC